MTNGRAIRIFKGKWFAKFARKNGLSDAALKAAILEIEAGSFDADLGGHVYKQRIARDGQGKRGGYRTIVVFKRGKRAFFVYGFAKNKLENITENDINFYKASAKDLLAAFDKQLLDWTKKDIFEEIIEEAQK